MITAKILPLTNISRTIIFMFIGFVVFSLSVFYVFQIIQITRESYSVLDYQRELQNLLQNNEGLEICFTENRSLDNIELIAQELNYEKIGKIHYITLNHEMAIQTIDNIVVAK